MPAKIEMPLEEFDAIRKARIEAETRCAELEALIQNKVYSDDASLALRGTVRVARAALSVARFAVANLPPELHRKWPSTDLKEIAAFLPMMPDKTPDDGDLARELVAFAEECERHEQRRATKATINKATIDDILAE